MLKVSSRSCHTFFTFSRYDEPIQIRKGEINMTDPIFDQYLNENPKTDDEPAPEETPERQEPLEQDSTPPEEPTSKPEKKKKGRTALWVVAAILVGALVGAAVMWAATGAARSVAAMLQPGQSESRSYSVEEKPISHTILTNTGDKSLTPAEVYEQNVGAVVGISTESTQTNVFGQRVATASSGSGFVLTSDGYVVTNYHVVQGANTINVTLYNGEKYPAKYIGGYSHSDVALLKIEAQDLQCVSVGSSDDLIVGEQVAAIGNPLGQLTFSMTVGYVSALDREFAYNGESMDMIQTDVAINAGSSGGPLFDMNGNVVGITSAKYSGQTSTGSYIEGLSFAIPIDDVLNILYDLQENGHVTGQAYLGVMLRDLDASTAQVYSLPVGPYVDSVIEGSCAEKAGVQAGDIILSLGDKTVETRAQLAGALHSYRAGDQTTLTVFRAGQEVTLNVTLDEAPTEAEQTSQPQTEEPVQQIPGFSIPGFDFFFGR